MLKNTIIITLNAVMVLIHNNKVKEKKEKTTTI